MSNWVDAFQTVEPISATDRFNIYKAKNKEGTYFVKEIGKDANVWNRTSIKKEYEIYSTIDLQHYMTPDVYKYEDSKILSVEWIDIQPWDNISDNAQVHNLIDDLVLLLTDIQNQDFNSVETRWPGTDEFSNRLDATVSFNPDSYDRLKPVVKKAKSKVESMEVPDDDISVVHGDLFYPNILFNSDGQLKTVIDWEISGIYDCMYDVGFIESNILEIASLYDNTLSRDDILTEFRSKLGISQRQLRRVHLYKIWPHYTKLAAIDANDIGSDYYPDSVDAEDAVQDLFDRTVLDSNLDNDLTF